MFYKCCVLFELRNLIFPRCQYLLKEIATTILNINMTRYLKNISLVKRFTGPTCNTKHPRVSGDYAE
jgi:hypothetical protein